MGEAAADRSPVAYRGMRHLGDRFSEQRHVGRHLQRSLEVNMARQSTDADNVTFNNDATQLIQFAYIDDQFRRDQTQIHRGQQALAAREHLGSVAVSGKQLQCVRNAACACVAESRGFH